MLITAQASQIFRELTELDHFPTGRAWEVAQFVDELLTKKQQKGEGHALH